METTAEMNINPAEITVRVIPEKVIGDIFHSDFTVIRSMETINGCFRHQCHGVKENPISVGQRHKT